MPLDSPKADWLSQATGLTVLPAGGAPTADDGGKAKLKRKNAEEAIADQARKTMMISDTMRMIGPLQPVLRKAFDLEVSGESGKAKQLQAKDGDLANTAEIQDVRSTSTVSRGSSKGSSGDSPAEDVGALLNEARRAFQLIDQMKNELLEATTTRSRLDRSGTLIAGPAEPLFTTIEITDELYTPLIRARIVPDTIVIGKFSKVQQMLDATNELYRQELVDAEDPDSGVAALAKGLISVGKELATPILEAAGVDSTLAMTLLKGCTALAESSIDLGSKAHAGLDTKSVTEFFTGLPNVLGTMVGTALGQPDLGKAIGSAGSVGAAGIALIITGIKAKKPDVGGLVMFFSDVLSKGLAEIPSGGSTGEAGVTLGDSLQALIAKTASKYGDDFYEAVRSGDAKRARGTCKSMCVEIAVSMPSLAGDLFGLATSGADLPDEVGEAVDTIQETIDDAQEAFDDNQEETAELMERLEKASNKEFAQLESKVDTAEAQRALDEQDGEKIAASVKLELEEAKREFTNDLDGLNDLTASQKTVEKLIAKIQKDRAILAVAIAIGQGGASLAAQFFPPAAIASEAIKMAANMAAAVERAVYLRKFIDESVGAKNATSPYLTSIQNFIENQATQLTHYSLAAALNGVKIAAAAAAMAHPAAAPALPIIGAIQSATEVLYEFYNANQVRKAWDVTKSALLQPQNRTLGLKARKMNPTLAKYAIAYGSTVDRDPVAVSMANACGLDNETLKNRDTNVIKVKMYLEVKFKDDNKVVGSFTEAAVWTDDLPEPALDVTVIARTYQLISGSPPYRAKNPSGAERPPSDLLAMIRTIQKQKLPEPPSSEDLSTRLTLAGQMVTSLRQEMVRLGSFDSDFETALDALVDAADNHQEKVAMQLVRLKIAESNAPPLRR